MGHFPFFMEIGGKKGVILGGGRVAARKVEKLLPFGPVLTCIAPAIEEELEQLSRSGEALTFVTGKPVKKTWKAPVLSLRLRIKKRSTPGRPVGAGSGISR